MSANALCIKAQAIYGNRILPEEYEQLCRKQSVADIASYLQSQPHYQEIFTDIAINGINRQQIEDLIDKCYFIQCGKLIRFAPKKQQPFYVQQIMYLEMEILVNKVIQLTNHPHDAFAISVTDYIAHNMSFDVYGLIPITTYEGLQHYVQGTKYEAVFSAFDFTSNFNINDLEQQLTELIIDSSIRTIKQCFTGSQQEQLIDILKTSIELKNITRIYRQKKYFKSTPEQRSMHVKYKRKSNLLLEELQRAKDMNEFLQILTESRYHLQSQEDGDSIFIEHEIAKINVQMAKKELRFSKDAAVVFLAFCTLQSIEILNLTHIIEGIHYNQSADRMEEMLIYV